MRLTTKTIGVIFLSFVTLLVGPACSMKDNLDDMHDKTNQMADTTEKMAQDSKKIKAISEHTFAILRPGEGKKLRDDSRECLNNSELLSDKFACASAFYYAFEFQYWQDEGIDDDTKLLNLKEVAVRELFEFLKSYYTPNNWFFQDYKPLNQHLLDLYAIAGAMHNIYPDQKMTAAQKGFVPLSMLAILEEGLKDEYENPTADPAKLPKWRYYTSVYYPEGVDLLKKRVTVLAFLPFATFNHLDRMYEPKVLWKFWKGETWWEVDPSQYKWSTLDYYTAMIKHALTARHFLNQIGEDAIPDNTRIASLQIAKLYQHMKIKYDGRNRAPEFVAKENQMNLFSTLVNILMGPLEDFKKVDPAIYHVDL